MPCYSVIVYINYRVLYFEYLLYNGIHYIYIFQIVFKRSVFVFPILVDYGLEW